MPSPDAFSLLAHQRRSVRAFLPTPVPDAQLHALLATARRAPSGANLQPGHFIAVRGAARARLSEALVQAWRSAHPEQEDYGYFPRPMPRVLKRRQVAAAQALYGALGVARDDRAGRDAHFERNFRFFDAPVALVVALEHDFGSGGYMDLGMALYGLMLAAEAQGLASCAIGALASYPGVVREQLGLDGRFKIVCGMALGHADPQAPVNQTRTERCELDEYFRVIE
ncbi:nitroreductase [Macromonas nakdongensis]|uniref:nitroreductase n=1 Tax=Macromonas nakdongensis TaxID=1843082 RepID=UPI0018E37D3E|nr:nitroreductase [Macromonas nakdongensis]